MIDLSRYPKTVGRLTEKGIALTEGKPTLTEPWRMHGEPHVRGARKEHRQRQESVRRLGEKLPDPETVLFLGWVLLTDSWRHVRAEAVHALARLPTEQGQAFLALALADRSQLVVRAAQAGLKKQGGLTAFLVLVALWEERGAEREVVQEALVAVARHAPQPGMRAVLPRLEQEARRFLILPRKRRRLRELIEALDQATAHLKDLPLTAMASAEVENLPLVSNPPASAHASLQHPPLPQGRVDASFTSGRVGSENWIRRVQRWFRS